ncbi:40S ribosomal protein S12 [Fukomys damarensis]|uniref:40S ribosomal protein S12 n=1 Tax=Fukomys damarensis TaxID=885580 RepID=A0A091DJJ3_FUKDA|nr:40S ribosomal protein S12 [Fukomys damarensis]
MSGSRVPNAVLSPKSPHLSVRITPKRSPPPLSSTLKALRCPNLSIAAGGVMDVNTALQEVLKTALIHDGLARGIREAAKALDKRQAHLCVLASNCDEPMYVKLVEALCAEHQINLIKVDDNKKLGEWVGLCKIDREGKPRKVVGCSCVVVKVKFSSVTSVLKRLAAYTKVGLL